MMNTKQKTKVIGESTDREQRANSAPLHTMSPEEQRSAIAEACGWHDVKIRDGWCYGYRTPDQDEEGKDVPDYLSDLNAMHEAEKVLCDLTDDVSPWDTYDSYLGANPTHATATQRAEAFLRTIGKWTEGEQGSAERAGETNTDTQK